MLEEVWRLQTDTITWQKVDDAVIVFDLRTSTSVSIDGPGVVIWEALTPGANLDHLVRVVTERFDVSEEIARLDIHRFLVDLASRRMASSSKAEGRHR